MAPKGKDKGKAAKSAKASRPIQVAADFEVKEVDEFADTVVGEGIVLGILEDILSNCDTCIYENYLQRKAIPYAARTIMNEVASMMKWVFLPCDYGDVVLPSVKTILEPEPAATTLESWARGAIPVKKRQSKMKERDAYMLDDQKS